MLYLLNNFEPVDVLDVTNGGAAILSLFEDLLEVCHLGWLWLLSLTDTLSIVVDQGVVEALMMMLLLELVDACFMALLACRISQQAAHADAGRGLLGILAIRDGRW